MQAAAAATFLLSVAIALPFAVVWWHADAVGLALRARLDACSRPSTSSRWRSPTGAARSRSSTRSTRGLAPLLVLGFAVVWLGHDASSAEIAGVLLVVRRRRARARARRAAATRRALLLTATLAVDDRRATRWSTGPASSGPARSRTSCSTLAVPCLIYPPLVGARAIRRELGWRVARGRARERRLVHARPARAAPRQRCGRARRPVVVGRDRDGARRPAARRARLASAAGRARCSSSPGSCCSRSSEVDIGKRSPAADEQRRRQADDVQVVAVDPLDEAGAEALDRVARPRGPPTRRPRRSVASSPRVSGRNVTSVVTVCSSSHASRPQAEPRDDLVRPAGERREHRSRLGGVRRLAEHRAVEQHLGVDAEHGPPAAVDRARLAGRALERVAVPGTSSNAGATTSNGSAAASGSRAAAARSTRGRASRSRACGRPRSPRPATCGAHSAVT